MKENREKFKQFVIEQLKDYDEYGEASTEGYAEIITDEAVKLFCQPAVIKSVCENCSNTDFNETMGCRNYLQGFKCENFKQTVL